MRRTLSCVVLVTALGAGLDAQEPRRVLEGVVVDATGTPIEGALVLLDGSPEGSVRTGPDGSFRLVAWGRGSHFVGVRGAGYAPRTVTIGPTGGEVGVLTLQPGPEPTATLSGRVVGPAGRPLPGMQVELNERVRGSTDDGGAFRLSNVPVVWGLNRLRVSGLGYSARSEELWITESGATESRSFQLAEQAVELPEILVQRAAAPLVPAGFTERRRSTNGYFLDRVEIETRNPSGVTNLMETVPGVRVRPSPEGLEIAFTRRTRSLSRDFAAGDALRLENDCRSPLVYLDGVLVRRDTRAFVELDDLASPETLTGIEVYNGASTVPAAFNTVGAGCGVVALWTIHYRPPAVPAAASYGTSGSWSTRRKVLVGAVVVPAAALLFRTVVCSLPHYCE